LISLSFIVLVGGAAVFWTKTMYHFKTVDSQKLYRSGTLSNFALEIAHTIYGIKTIVNLRSEKEMKEDWYTRERKFAESHGIEVINIPMLPDTPPSSQQIQKFLSIVTNPDMQPVHCEMGVIRTGMMVAVYDIDVLKLANGRVFEDLPWFGHTFERRPAVKQFILEYKT